MTTRIMLYGTYSQDAEERAKRLVSELVTCCIRKGIRFVSRSGAALEAVHDWPHANPKEFPIDNLVIPAIAAVCNEEGKKRPVAHYLRTYANHGRTDTVDVGQEILQSPSRRFEMYSVLLDDVDTFIFIGGNDGVLRLGLLCHFLQRPFVAVPGFGGAAEELGNSFYQLVGKKDHYQNLNRTDCLRLRTPNLTGKELFQSVMLVLRPRILFALGETLRNRMTLANCLRTCYVVADRWMSILGKLSLIALVVTLTLNIFRVQLRDAFEQIREVFKLMSQAGGYQ